MKLKPQFECILTIIVDGRALRENEGLSRTHRVAIRGKERSVAVPMWAKVPTAGSRQHSPFVSTLRRREIHAFYTKTSELRIERE